MKNGKRAGKVIGKGIARFGAGMKEAYSEAYGPKITKRKTTKKVTSKRAATKGAPLTKIINGKRYKKFATEYSNKEDAAFMALDLRGYKDTVSARVVKVGNKYWVYHIKKQGNHKRT